jgi:predicted ATP-dependent serine protease
MKVYVCKRCGMHTGDSKGKCRCGADDWESYDL